MNRRSLFKTLAAALIPAPLLAKPQAPRTITVWGDQFMGGPNLNLREYGPGAFTLKFGCAPANLQHRLTQEWDRALEKAEDEAFIKSVTRCNQETYSYPKGQSHNSLKPNV